MDPLRSNRSRVLELGTTIDPNTDWTCPSSSSYTSCLNGIGHLPLGSHTGEPSETVYYNQQPWWKHNRGIGSSFFVSMHSIDPHIHPWENECFPVKVDRLFATFAGAEVRPLASQSAVTTLLISPSRHCLPEKCVPAPRKNASPQILWHISPPAEVVAVLHCFRLLLACFQSLFHADLVE